VIIGQKVFVCFYKPGEFIGGDFFEYYSWMINFDIFILNLSVALMCLFSCLYFVVNIGTISNIILGLSLGVYYYTIFYPLNKRVVFENMIFQSDPSLTIYFLFNIFYS